MKKGRTFFLSLLPSLCLYLSSIAQKTVTYYNQTFKIDTLYPKTGSTGMNTPWEMVYGPDDSLWVTSAHDYFVYKIHPGNKGVRKVLDLSGNKDFDGTVSAWPQGGLMGLAIHPGFLTGKPWVYLAYVYHLVGCGTSSGGSYCSYNTQIVRFSYSFTTGKLTPMDTVITGLDGSNDHNSGRIRLSPLLESDGKYHLYYTLGDMGAGNLANINRPNHAQDTTIVEGKTLRLNTEPDNTRPAAQKWIPADNPFTIGGVVSPIYSFGHRNPQGLTFGSVNGGTSYILYSCEHGDQSDDEINIILPHKNYGWPKVAGLCDDNYTSFSGDTMKLAGKAVISETGFCDTTHTELHSPMFSFYNWSRAANKAAEAAPNNMWWPTVAPSSIAFYGQGAIPGWNYSLLMTTLKNGLFRVKLKADGLSVDSTQQPVDTLHYLVGYRLRNITVAPTGDTLFISTDNSCCSWPNGVVGTSSGSASNAGFILRMVYLTTLALHDTSSSLKPPVPVTATCRVFPNPAHKTLYVEGAPGERKPWVATIYDMRGTPLVRSSSSDDNFSMDISGLSPGMYVVRLLNGYTAPLLTEKIFIY